ncbi:unnamed protein product [Allacma fusca]|uniref:Uncharacterized protein n=1 Tax=Allacma fusca TaxID=39272 RepID=A0A8J2KKG5_9HEXA|nr:unnamed protein product [Allacma fusca]
MHSRSQIAGFKLDQSSRKPSEMKIVNESVRYKLPRINHKQVDKSKKPKSAGNGSRKDGRRTSHETPKSMSQKEQLTQSSKIKYPGVHEFYGSARGRIPPPQSCIKCQQLRGGASVHSYGRFTLNGHPGHTPVKTKFCSDSAPVTKLP